ncbi:hypothetical protein ACQ4PT_063213 [Festuca glaucescens]
MAPNLRSPCEEFAFLCAMMRRYAVVEELSALGAPCTPALGRSGAPSAEMKEWEAKGFRVTGSVCDVSVREQRERLIRDVADRFAGKLNILVTHPLHPPSSIYLPVGCGRLIWEQGRGLMVVDSLRCL